MKRLFLILALCCPAAFGSLTTVYVAQTAAGSNNGTSCANAYAVSFFNTSGNWGSGSGQIGAGTTVNLCGTITTQLTAHGSGSSGNPITISFQSTAIISLPVCDNTNGCIDVSGLSWITIDGGTACGAGTACSTGLTGTGIIKETANGSTLANQQDSIAINAQSGCANCEFKNLIIGPLYQHTSSADTRSFGADGAIYMAGCNGCATKIHDMTAHDTSAILNYIPVASGDNGLQVYNVNAYNYNGGVNIAGSGSSNILSGAAIHDSVWGATANWDATGCPYHHDGIHAWGLSGGGVSGLSYYNNLVNGNYGGCPTGAVFFEGYTHDFNMYNNLFLITYTQENAGIVTLTGFNMGFYNNTIQGAAQSGDICFSVYYNSGSGTPYTPSISYENNVVSNCGTVIELQNTPTLTAWDYNAYGQICMSCTLVYNSGSFESTLAAWKSACSCDAHSVLPTGGPTAPIGLTSAGVPQSGSPVIGAGVNLTSLSITPLNSTSSAGGTVATVARPGSGAWTIGALVLSSGPPPPTNLTGTVVASTPTQGIINIAGTNGTACLVEVSTSPTYAPLINDVNETLFSGSGHTSRAGTVGGIYAPTFIVGTRAARIASNGQRLSRALAAETAYYWRVNNDAACGTGTVTGTFVTQTIPFGRTYADAIAVDSTTPGQAAWPQQIGTTPLTDPQTGLTMVPIQLPGDAPAHTGSMQAFGTPYDPTGNWGGCTGLPCTYTGTGQGKLILPITMSPSQGIQSSYEITSWGFLDFLYPHVTASADATRVVNFCLMVGGGCLGNTVTATLTTSGATYNIAGNTNGMTDWSAQPRFNQHLIAQRSGCASCTYGQVTVLGTVATAAAGTFAPPYTAGTPIVINGTTYTIPGTNTDSDSQLTLNTAPGNGTYNWTLTPFALAIWPSTSASQTITMTAANFDYEVDDEAQEDSSPMQLASNSTGGPSITVGGCIGYLAFHTPGLYWESGTCATRNYLGQVYVPYDSGINPPTQIPQGAVSGGAVAWDPVNAGTFTVAVPGYNGETSIYKGVYSGTYAQYTQGMTLPTCGSAPCITWTQLESSLDAKALAYSAAYTADCCSAGWTMAGGCPDGTLMLQDELAGQQGVAGWYMIYQPSSTSILALRRSTDYYPMGGASGFHSIMPRCAIVGGNRIMGIGAQQDQLGATFTQLFSGTDALPTIGPYLSRVPAGLSSTPISCPSYSAGLIAAPDWPGGGNNPGTSCSSLTMTTTNWEDPSPYKTPCTVTVAASSTAVTSGPNCFLRQYAGKAIVLNGTTYGVASWTNQNAITLATPFAGSSCAVSCTGTILVEPPASFTGQAAYNTADFVLRSIRQGDVGFVSFPTTGVTAPGGGNNTYSTALQTGATEPVMFLFVGKNCTGTVGANLVCVQRNYGGTSSVQAWPVNTYLALDANGLANFFKNNPGTYNWDTQWNTTLDPTGSLGVSTIDYLDQSGHAFRGSGISSFYDNTNVCLLQALWNGVTAQQVCYATRYGANFTYSTAPFTYISMTAPFSGLLGTGAPNDVDTHASWNYFTAPNFIADNRPMNYTEGPANNGARVSGTLFHWTATQWGFPTVAAALASAKTNPLIAWCGTNPMVNISGPSAVIDGTSAHAYQYLVVVAANEGVSGSSPGDLYANCPGASILSANDPGTTFNGGNEIDISVAPMGAWVHGGVQVNTSATNPGSAPTRWLGHLLSNPRWYNVFWSSRFVPDGSGILSQAIGSDYSRGITIMAIPPPIVYDTINGSDFVKVPVTCNQITGANGCGVEFGYADNGTASGYYCTPRAEACITSATSGYAFSFETTGSFTPASFTGGTVTLSVPGISGRVLYYRVKQYNSGTLVFTGQPKTVAVP